MVELGELGVLSVGILGRVRAAGPAFETGADLGCHPALTAPVAPDEDELARVAAQLAEGIAAAVRERPVRLVLVLPARLPNVVVSAVGQALEARGLALTAAVERRVLARAVAQESGGAQGAWLLDADRDGFGLIDLDGERRLHASSDLERTVEYRRTAVAVAFREEHQVDIKHAGGSPERIDAWLEDVERRGLLAGERTLEWQLPDGTHLTLRAGPLRRALEGVHAGAILSIENACLEACTREPGAIVVARAVETWFRIAPTLRASLPGTRVALLGEDDEAAAVDRWLRGLREAGTGRAWVAGERTESAADKVTWRPAAPAPSGAAASGSAPEPAPADPAPVPATTRATSPRRATEARPRSLTGVYAALGVLALGQVALLLWTPRGALGAERGGDALSGAPEGVREELQGFQSALRAEVEARDAFAARVASLEEELAARADGSETRALRQEIDALRGALEERDESGDAWRTEVMQLREELQSARASLDSVSRTVAALSAAPNGSPEAGSEAEGVRERAGLLDQRLTASEESLAALLSSWEALRGEVASLSKRMEGVRGIVETLPSPAWVEGLDRERAELTQRVHRSEQELVALSGSTASVGADVAAAGTRLDELAERVGELEEPDWLATLLSRTDALEQEVQKNRRGVETVKHSLERGAGDEEAVPGTLHPDVASQRFRAFNTGEQRVARLGDDPEGHGSLKLYNKEGDRQVLLGSGEGGGAGYLGTYNTAGKSLFKVTTHSANAAGHLSLANAKGQRRVAMTTDPEDAGVLWLMDRTGKTIELIGGGGDLAEAVRPAPGHAIEPGQLVRAAGADEHGPLVAPTSAPADARVLGIVSGAGGLAPAVTLNRTGAPGERAVALAGQVFCLVDAAPGAIRPGDLLVSSPTPGHAMRADPANAPPGAVVGKALEGLERGTGLVRVWVGPR